MQKIAPITDIKNTALCRTTFQFIIQLLNFLWKLFLKTLLIFINVITWFLANILSPEVIEASIHDSEKRDAEEEIEKKQKLKELLDQQYRNRAFHRKS